MKSYTREVYGGPEILQLKELPTPSPKANEVLVKVRSASINPADWRLLRADPFLVRLMMGLFKPKYKQLGADMSGEVTSIGSGVNLWKVGDEVVSDIMKYGMGAYGDYVCVPQEALVRKPKNVSFDEAAAVPIAGLTALQALRDHGQVKAGQQVLINGASGGVGTYAVQIAKYLGAHVTAICSSNNKELVLSLGADKVISYNLEDYRQSNERFDLILDNVGNCSFQVAKSLLKSNGTSLLIGWSGFGHMLSYSLKGALATKTSQMSFKSFTAKMDNKDLEMMMELLANGSIKSIIEKSFPMEQLANAILLQEKGRTKGKIVVHN